MLKRFYFLSTCAMCLLSPVTSMAAPSTVPDDARMTIEMVKAEAKNIAEQAKSQAQAETALVQAEGDVARLEMAKDAKESEVAQAQVALRHAELAIQIAKADEATATAEVVAAREVLERAKIIAARAEADAEEFRSAEEAAANAVDIAAANAAKLNNKATTKAEAAADREYTQAAERTLVAERQAEAEAMVAEAAEASMAAIEERLEAATQTREEAQEKENDAKGAVIDAQTELEDIKKDLVLLRAEVAQGKAAVLETKKEPDLAKRRWATAEVECKYYTWQDHQGNSGYQLYQPYTFNFVDGNMEYSLRTGYVTSANKSDANGRVATWTDTVLGLAYSKQQHKDTIVYRLDINMPTGKGTLNGTGAIMSDDLVEMSRFGEGWNYTPGVWISRKTSKEDTWTLGTYYTFRSRYTYDGSFANGWLKPGNVWVKDLRWQHAGQKWQLVGELSHTSAGTTQDGNITYQQGDQLNMNLTYNRVLSEDQDLMLYYWNGKEQPYTSADPFVIADKTKTQYIGAMWSKTLARKRTFRIGVDMMKRDGNSYDPLTTLTSNERTKYSWGVGYDIDIAADRKASVDIKQFHMKDNVSSNNRYHGYNIYVRYTYNM